MNEEVKEYIDKYPNEIRELYINLRTLLNSSVSQKVEEKLWAKLPSYYVGENFVRLIPFKNHINIEAAAVIKYKSELKGFKITQKGMLQIYLTENIPSHTLEKLFRETLLI